MRGYIGGYIGQDQAFSVRRGVDVGWQAMKNRALAANERVLIGVIDVAFCGERVEQTARMLKRVGLTLEIESESPKELRLYAARRIVTNDVSQPVVMPVAKVKTA